MALTRLYVARDEDVTVVSRRRLRMSGSRPVRRAWTALIETTSARLNPRPTRSSRDAALVVLPPLLAGAVPAAFGQFEIGLAAAGAVFFGMSYLTPVLRRRRAKQGPRPSGTAEVYLLSTLAERAAFDRAIETADRISETWPALGVLVDAADAEAMLAAALWEIAGLLARRQELNGVLADLSRPDFAAVSPSDDTAQQLRAHLATAKVAKSQLESELSRREASLRRAEEAGRNFIREQQMRQAIRDAEESLRGARSPELPAAATDPGAELAEHTQSVVTAYRELTASLHPDLPNPT